MMQRLTPGRVALLAAVFACVVYANALRNDFAYDDVPVIARDTVVHSLANVPSLFGRNYWSGDTVLALYRPVTTMTFAVDWAISDGSPTWFHAMNVGWHALATALATLLMAALFGTAAALVGGALFALHPVHVEAVANVVGRAELIAACALFGAALLWLRPRTNGHTAGVALLFALGLLAKESVIALPLLLPLLDVAKGERTTGGVRAYLREHATAYAVLAAVALGYLLLRQQVLGTLAPARVDPALEVAAGYGGRVLTALQGWPHVLRLLFFPKLLLSDYGPRIIMPAATVNAQVLLGGSILAAAVVFGALALVLKRGRAALLLLWVPVAMLPVSNLVVPIGVIVAERMLYIPSFAAATAIGVLAAGFWPARRVAVIAVGSVLLVLGAARTWARTPVWQQTDRVFVAQLIDRPDSFRAHWHRARVLRSMQRNQEALMAYRMAIGLWPYRHGLVSEAAAFEAASGQLARARELARFTARRWPEDVAAYRLIAGASLDLGDTTAARAAILKGLAVDSTDTMLRRMRAAVNRP